MFSVKTLIAFMTLMAVLSPSRSAVNAEEFKQLGTSLTEWGAEKAGNAEGTIPAYVGDRPALSKDYDSKTPGRRPDPYREKPLFTITAENMAQHSGKLTEGQIALFKKYPSFRMDIYPTHRTAAFPKYIVENTLKNATSCNTTNDGLILDKCYGGFPFPIPKTGNEVLWNHLVRPRFHGWAFLVKTYMVDASGKPLLQGFLDVHQTSPFIDPANKGPVSPQSLFYQMRYDALAPARKVGEKLVILDGIDFVNVGRRVYQYVPGQRRVKLAPDLAYDTPNPVSAGVSTMDENQLFYGPMDRYNWKLIGKQEKYIMYHNFALTDFKACPDNLALTKNFINPDCNRHELHRVWVVQGTIKPGFRHIYPKRTLYFDEDLSGAGTADNFDASGKIYRTDNNVHVLFNEMQTGQIAEGLLTYDLQTGSWYASAMMGEPGNGVWAEKAKPDNHFSPEAMAGEGIR